MSITTALARYLDLKAELESRTEVYNEVLQAHLKLNERLLDAREDIREELGSDEEFNGEVMGRMVKAFVDNDHHVQVHQEKATWVPVKE